MSNQIIDKIRCTRCQCFRISSEFLNKNKDKILKSCQKCRDIVTKSIKKNKCIHNKQKSYCKDCGGSALCIHNRQKNLCKECGGSSICIHNKQKNHCKDCGISFCIHNRQKSHCKDCGGSLFCIHDRQKSQCKECGGSAICIHNRQKSQCKECGGSAVCIHNRQVSRCKECGGSSICIHNRVKNSCKDCMNPEEKIKYIIKTMILGSRKTDKNLDRYDADNFIDMCFLEGLFEDTKNCHYCHTDFTYNNRIKTFVTIERLDNAIGHIKSNCVLACWGCNMKHKSKH